MNTQLQSNLDLVWSQPAPESAPASAALEDRISEVILPSLGFSMAALIAPMLTQLSRNHSPRWLTLICSQGQARDISRWLKTTGVVVNKLLLLTAEDEQGCLSLSRKVLAAGNSHTVISWLSQSPAMVMGDLEQAASIGDSAGVIIRQRRG
ncbi:SulA-like leucine-rich domain-containing protein [Parendozoicomonas haliclonae]|uniref:Cell division inhibitor SulA n=1 Tax=Parendozoicomonas haliclonae TaxID=1960125 RepID=A0A1X7AKW5_9GAMM|nr:SulA-like leucine-rich domain-containing protein [Parendozoicomonas haliclonae]SMA47754.1 Cell division inhibitor SulA [Parendozoicomonas haliclonae]